MLYNEKEKRETFSNQTMIVSLYFATLTRAKVTHFYCKETLTNDISTKNLTNNFKGISFYDNWVTQQV